MDVIPALVKNDGRLPSVKLGGVLLELVAVMVPVTSEGSSCTWSTVIITFGGMPVGAPVGCRRTFCPTMRSEGMAKVRLEGIMKPSLSMENVVGVARLMVRGIPIEKLPIETLPISAPKASSSKRTIWKLVPPELTLVIVPAKEISLGG